MTQPISNAVQALIVTPALQNPPGPPGPVGPVGPPGSVPGEIVTDWVELLTNAATTIWADTTPLAVWEDAIIAVRFDVEEIGAHAVGGSIIKTAQVQNVSGVVTDVLTQATSGWDRDVSDPPPPANLSAAVQGTVAHILAPSATLTAQATRPAGIPIRVRAIVSMSRKTRPVIPYALSISPTFGATGGGTPVTIHGEGLAGATAVTLDGIAATVTASDDLSVSATSLPGSAGTGDVVVTTPNGPATITGGWTYTPGVIPTISNVTPNVASADGGATYGPVIITGTNFTGATAVTFNGATQVFTVNSDTQITVAAPANVTDNTKWGLGDVIITSRTSNTNASGNNLWFYLPTGLLSWHRADMATFDGGNNLLTWPDRVSTTPFPALFKGGQIPFVANDVGGRGAVTLSLFGNLCWNLFAATYYTGPQLSVLMVAKRPTADASGNAVILEAADCLDNNLGITENNGFTILDTPAHDAIWRNNVSASSASSPDAVNPFCMSVRLDGSLGTLRINGTDVAQIPQTGNMHINCLSAQRGMNTFGRLSSTAVTELHLADMFAFSRAFTARDLAVMTAYIAWYYPGLPAV